MTDIETLLKPCMENIEVFNEKLTNDINRLKLSEGILLDPVKFGQTMQTYNEAIKRATLEFTENKDLLSEIALIMKELIVVIKENEELILKGITAAESKSQTKEKSEYKNTIASLNELNLNLRKIALYGNIDTLFS